MSISSRASLRRVRLIVPMFAASLAVAGCKGTEDAKTAGPNDVGGTVVIATAADASSLLPSLVTVITDRQVTDLLFDRLADIGDNLNAVGDIGFKPQLAERWEWAPDSLSIAFHINPHAKWHDGQPVRASDVRYSVNIIKDPALGSQAIQLISNVDSVAVRDSLTAVVWFKRHTPEQFYDLVYQVVIVPEHVLGNTPVAKLKESEVSRRGIGSGRFRLAKWEAGSRIELVADTANYRGRAKLDRVVFAISPDFNAAATRFFAGDADLFENLRAEQVAKLVNDTSRRSVAYPSLEYAFLAFNLADPKDHSKPNPIFSERAVRRALTMAVDRRAMLKNVFDSIARPLYGPFPYSLVVADTTLPQLPYDTVRAKALLDSAGWLAGTDGIRAKNGRRLEFAITTPSSSAARKQYAVLMQDAFRRVGVAVKLDESDFASYMAKQNNRGFEAEMAELPDRPEHLRLQASLGIRGHRQGRHELHLLFEPHRRRAARQRHRDLRSRAHQGVRAARLRDDHRGCARHLAVRAADARRYRQTHSPDLHARRRLVVWHGGLVDSGGSAQRARQDRSSSGAVTGAAVPRGADCCRRLASSSSSRRCRSSSSISRRAIRSRSALQGQNVTESVREQWRADYGLDRPIGEQYLRWVQLVARGQLGYSLSHRRPVRDVFADAMPRTLLLVGARAGHQLRDRHRRRPAAGGASRRRARPMARPRPAAALLRA